MQRYLDFDVTTFLDSLQKAVDICTEYDLIPHVADEHHQYLVICDSAFGICDCTIKLVFCRYTGFSEFIPHNLLNYLLLIAPNTTTFWNYRRQSLLTSNNAKELANAEIKFTQLILSKYPRSNETILYRQWIVEKCNYLQDDEFLLNEFKLCNRIADKYRCNYGLWQYRRFLLRHSMPKIYDNELKHMNEWLEKHPTDTSGWSYLFTVLNSLLKHSVLTSTSTSPSSSLNNQLQLESVKDILKKYFEKVHNILKLYPERESVWTFRRQLITLWLQLHQNHVHDNPNIENIDSILNEVEPLLPESLNIISALKLSRDKLFHGLSFNEFLTWSHKNNLCKEPSSLKWVDLLLLRYLFWLSERITDSCIIQ
ncbi:unnamed protein product [Trichobilharzia szidati]|nr:unnamed protein product [Trichobilharzia szidati]